MKFTRIALLTSCLALVACGEEDCNWVTNTVKRQEVFLECLKSVGTPTTSVGCSSTKEIIEACQAVAEKNVAREYICKKTKP